MGEKRYIWLKARIRYNQCRDGGAHYIAPLAAFRGRACCRRYVYFATFTHMPWKESDD